MEVEDNGPGPASLAEDSIEVVATDTDDQSIGLSNVAARLDAHYGDHAGVSLRRSPTGGCIARLHLPFMVEDSETGTAS